MQAFATEGRAYNLVYLDPPYGTGETFLSHGDSADLGEWAAHFRPRIQTAARLVAKNGVAAVSVGIERIAEATIECKRAFKWVHPIVIKRVPQCRTYGYINATHEYLLICGHARPRPNPAVTAVTPPREFFSHDFFMSGSYQKKHDTGVSPTVGDYPVYVAENPLRITGLGKDYTPGEGETAIYSHTGHWRWSEATAREAWRLGALYPRYKKDNTISIHACMGWTVKGLKNGSITIQHDETTGQPTFRFTGEAPGKALPDFWDTPLYHTETGTRLARAFGCQFLYPKSLYMLEDILKLFAPGHGKILDVYGGSGTLVHAVAKVNTDYNKTLDCDAIDINENGNMNRELVPRLQAALTGQRDGKPVKGKYRTGQKQPFANGLDGELKINLCIKHANYA